MRKFIFIFFFFLLAKFSFAQVNLVPNSSFEIYDTCPNYYGQIFRAQPWFSPTTGTPDYFHSCINGDVLYGNLLGVPLNAFGFQTAKTGTAYAGEYFTENYLDYREYIEVKLLSPLQVGTKYFVSFYISLCDSSRYSVDNMGSCFSVDSLKQDTFINIPTVPIIANPSGHYISNKNSWISISGNFIADSAYQYITIGNFKNDLNTDTLFVGGGYWGLYSDAYYYLDDVCVSDDSLTCMTGVGINNYDLQNNILLYPTVTSGIFFIEFNKINFNTANVVIYDELGSCLFTSVLGNKINSLNIADLSQGIYFVKITFDNQEIIKKIILTKS